MKILALVTARGGSKRLPEKNIKVLGGRPLINWTIDVVKGIDEICDILVSTDDPVIADIAKQNDALVPWLRPAELSNDTATSVDVAFHALDWYQTNRGDVDGLLLLQPTSPFRTRETVLEGIELFKRKAMKAVVGVSPAQNHPMWCVKIEQSALIPFINRDGLVLRSQDLPDAYVINGCFYLITPSELKAHRSFAPIGTVSLAIESPWEALDIDTAWDWGLAEYIAGTWLPSKQMEMINNE